MGVVTNLNEYDVVRMPNLRPCPQEISCSNLKMKRSAGSREGHSSARKRSKPSTSRAEEDEDTSEETPGSRVANKISIDSRSSVRKRSKASTSRVEEDEGSSEEMLDTSQDFDISQMQTQDEEKAVLKSEGLVNVSRPFT